MAYLRIQVFCTLFSKIIDLESIQILLNEIFDATERLAVLHTLGIMNLYDPMFPERSYKLDLRRWDHR